MKKMKFKTAGIIISCVLVCSALSGCSNEATPYEKESLQSSQQTETNKITIDVYEEQISYYMELVETLQAELLSLKEENYIDECEYKLHIESLEESIQTLTDRIEALTAEKPAPIVPSSPSYSTQSSVTANQNGNDAKKQFEYELEGGKVTIMRYIGEGGEVAIPQTIDNSPVVAIADDAFKGTSVTSVTIPEGVSNIGWFAFSNCTSLGEIKIPRSVTSVSYGAFDNCPRDLRIICERGSYIEAYAKSWGMTTVTE